VGLFDRAQKILDGVVTPMRVRLVGRVATPVDLVSPITHRRAALLHWTFSVNRRPTILPLADSVFEATGRGHVDPLNEKANLEHLATVIRGEELLVVVEDKTLVVLRVALVVRFLSAGEPIPVERAFHGEIVFQGAPLAPRMLVRAKRIAGSAAAAMLPLAFAACSSSIGESEPLVRPTMGAISCPLPPPDPPDASQPDGSAPKHFENLGSPRPTVPE
jgi:hypothetical protein